MPTSSILRCPTSGVFRVCPSRKTDKEEEKDESVQGNIYIYNPKSLQIQILSWLQIVNIYYLNHVFVLIGVLLCFYLTTIGESDLAWILGLDIEQGNDQYISSQNIGSGSGDSKSGSSQQQYYSFSDSLWTSIGLKQLLLKRSSSSSDSTLVSHPSSLRDDLLHLYFPFLHKNIRLGSLLLDYLYELGWTRIFTLSLCILLLWYFGPAYRKSVYCVDFEVAEPGKEWQISKEGMMQIIRAMGEGGRDGAVPLDSQKMLNQNDMGEGGRDGAVPVEDDQFKQQLLNQNENHLQPGPTVVQAQTVVPRSPYTTGGPTSSLRPSPQQSQQAYSPNSPQPTELSQSELQQIDSNENDDDNISGVGTEATEFEKIDVSRSGSGTVVTSSDAEEEIQKNNSDQNGGNQNESATSFTLNSNLPLDSPVTNTNSQSETDQNLIFKNNVNQIQSLSMTTTTAAGSDITSSAKSSKDPNASNITNVSSGSSQFFSASQLSASPPSLENRDTNQSGFRMRLVDAKSCLYTNKSQFADASTRGNSGAGSSDVKSLSAYSPPAPEFTQQSIDFMGRILQNSGIGDKTHWPPGIMRCLNDSLPQARNMLWSRAEAESIIFPIVEKLLVKTNTHPKQIDFLVVNCSLFCPTPSLCAMIANKFGMREDLNSYNLGGMGCSAGVISVDLAKQLIQNHRGKPGFNEPSLALVVSTENLTENLYRGNERSMMMQNTLFRCGGAAILLSSSAIHPRSGRKISFGSSSSKSMGFVKTSSSLKDSSTVTTQTQSVESQSNDNKTQNITVINSNTLSEPNSTESSPTSESDSSESNSNSNSSKTLYAKYKLLHSGRTCLTDDNSYHCVFQQQDEYGNKGVWLDKNLVSVAGRALTKQFTQLGPHVLPLSEQIKCVASYVHDWFAKNVLHYYFPDYFPYELPLPETTETKEGTTTSESSTQNQTQTGTTQTVTIKKPEVQKGSRIYTPDFRLAIDFFCIHAGGRAVIEGVQKNLKLSDSDIEPSMETLRRYGNTSSSSIWYELKYIEDNWGVNGGPGKNNSTNQGGKNKILKRGSRVLQIAFGSGFKCNSAVWLKL